MKMYDKKYWYDILDTGKPKYAITLWTNKYYKYDEMNSIIDKTLRMVKCSYANNRVGSLDCRYVIEKMDVDECRRLCGDYKFRFGYSDRYHMHGIIYESDLLNDRKDLNIVDVFNKVIKKFKDEIDGSMIFEKESCLQIQEYYSDKWESYMLKKMEKIDENYVKIFC